MREKASILVIDNFDSFTYNLVRYLRELGAEVLVRRNDELNTASIEELSPAGILLSPGPKRPSDAGISTDIVRVFAGRIPILGICLGHQVIAEVFGGHVSEGSEPVHGKNADILHDARGVFSGLPSPFSATRYHSLVVLDEGFPACLTVSARSEDGTIMGIRHRSLSVEGVQFHPEAVLTEFGHQLLANFLRTCGILPADHHLSGCEPEKEPVSNRKPDASILEIESLFHRSSPSIKKIEPPIDANLVFQTVCHQQGTVFLDSAAHDPEMGRYSIVAWSPWLAVTEWKGVTRRLSWGNPNETVSFDGHQAENSEETILDVDALTAVQTVLDVDALTAVQTILDVDALTAVQAILRENRCESSVDIPFPGGAIGMIGYDALKPYSSLDRISKDPSKAVSNQNVFPDPDADAAWNNTEQPSIWFWFHRWVYVEDHVNGTGHFIHCTPTDNSGDGCFTPFTPCAPTDESGAGCFTYCAPSTNSDVEPSHESWMRTGIKQVEDTAAVFGNPPPVMTKTPIEMPPGWQEHFRSNFTESRYCEAIEAMRDQIRKGDIYLANMTRQFRTTTDKTGLNLHQKLRSINPACFSAWFPLGEMELISASPERFLRIRDRWVETRPIKGTRPRGRTPEEDAANRDELAGSMKDQAELLMVTDLERNDLSIVCEPGTVSVSDLFKVEEHPTVFHLVANVTGKLEDGKDAVDCMRACFPGGSITGTPKIRAMEVIHDLEGEPRGAYTGCLGYFGFDGNADFNILIRTMVKQGDHVSFGVGGGITWDSVPSEEQQETLDKAKALMAALMS